MVNEFIFMGPKVPNWSIDLTIGKKYSVNKRLNIGIASIRDDINDNVFIYINSLYQYFKEVK